MIETAFIFGAILSAFTVAVLAQIPPRRRLRLLNQPTLLSVLLPVVIALGSGGASTGLLTAGIGAVLNMGALGIARWYWGWITVVNGRVRYYHGIVRYEREELM